MVSNIFYFHPYLGKIPNLTNIFQRGWNHQLALTCLILQDHCAFAMGSVLLRALLCKQGTFACDWQHEMQFGRVVHMVTLCYGVKQDARWAFRNVPSFQSSHWQIHYALVLFLQLFECPQNPSSSQIWLGPYFLPCSSHPVFSYP